jgi:hypothetical protein
MTLFNLALRLNYHLIDLIMVSITRGVTAAQYTASNKAAQLCSGQSISGEASSDVAIEDIKEGAKGGGKRCKQRL